MTTPMDLSKDGANPEPPTAALQSSGNVLRLRRIVAGASYALRVTSLVLMVTSSLLAISAAGMVNLTHHLDPPASDHAKVASIALSMSMVCVSSLVLIFRPYRLRQRCTSVLLILGYYSHLNSTSFIAAENDRKVHLDSLEIQTQHHLRHLACTLALVRQFSAADSPPTSLSELL